MRHSLTAELLKLRKRWMTWIVLGLLVAGVVTLPLMLFFIVELGDRLPGAEEMPEMFAEQMEDALKLPSGAGMLFSLIGGSSGFGALLFIIVAGVVIGNEFNWGTVRTSLIRGRSQTDFVVTKLLAVMLLALIGMVAALLVGLVVLLGLTGVMEGELDLGFLDGAFLSELVMGLLRTWFALLPYVLLAMFLSVLTRSTWVGVGFTLVYALIVEGLVLQLLSLLGGFWADLSTISISGNVNGLLLANIGGDAFSSGLRVSTDTPVIAYPSANQAFIVLSVYSLLLLIATLLIFWRRDVTAE